MAGIPKGGSIINNTVDQVGHPQLLATPTMARKLISISKHWPEMLFCSDEVLGEKISKGCCACTSMFCLAPSERTIQITFSLEA